MNTAVHYILRAQQKDDFYSQVIYERLSEIIKSIDPNLSSTLLSWNSTLREFSCDLKLLASILYYLCTIWISSQTLGEEYTQLNEVVQSSSSTWLPPSKRRRLILALLECVPLSFIRKLFSQTVQFLNLHSFSLPSTVVYIFDDILSALYRWHFAVFLLNGIYLSVAKRLTRIRLVNTDAPSTSHSSSALKAIAALLILQSIIRLLRHHIPFHQWLGDSIKFNRRFNDSFKKTKKTQELRSRLLMQTKRNLNIKCLFCFSNPPVSPTIPICGHIFCWNCIAHWCSTSPFCPMCRVPCHPQQLLPLHHYSPSYPTDKQEPFDKR